MVCFELYSAFNNILVFSSLVKPATHRLCGKGMTNEENTSLKRSSRIKLGYDIFMSNLYMINGMVTITEAMHWIAGNRALKHRARCTRSPEYTIGNEK